MSTLLSLPATIVPQTHTLIASLAFSTALFLGWFSGLWVPLCKNAVSQWPVEWLPSVSATIGDHAAPRAPFQILIALCATPRFLLLLVQWLVHRYPPSIRDKDLSHEGVHGNTTALSENGVRTRKVGLRSSTAEGSTSETARQVLQKGATAGSYADTELFVGIARTFCCGGWVYITSRDHHDLHDLFMILYLVLTLPWMIFSTFHATALKTKRKRTLVMSGFLLTIPPLIWTYYRHSVQRIPGAYTHYAFFEWSLVFWDVSFDYLSVTELGHLRIAIIDTTRQTEGEEHGKGHDSIRLASPVLRPKKLYDETLDWTSEGQSPIWRGVLAWASDAYFAVCFWTVFTSLGFQLFYWSVWKLALAGSEMALIANLSGFSLYSSSRRAWVTSREGLMYNRTITIVAGLGCYFIPSPLARLVGISVGTWYGWLAVFGDLLRLKGSSEVVVESQTFLIGIVATMLIKYLNYSTNPLWATTDAGSGGWNKTGLVLAAASLYEYYARPTHLFPAPPTLVAKDKPIAPVSTSRLQRTIIAAGLGSMIHLLQTFLMEAGTIIAWTWTGFPVKGPTLHPSAGFVIAASAIGVTSISARTPTLGLILWCIAGLGGAYSLYTFPDWLGFNGGLVMILYLVSAVPRLFRAASAIPASIFGYALLVNILLDVASVVTAAYAFVPMGWLLRERTDLVLGFCMLTTVAAEGVIFGLSLPEENRLQQRSISRISRTKKLNLLSGAVLAVLGIASSYNKMPTSPPVPYYPEHRIFSGGIWTVHFGVDEPGRDSQRRIMELVRDMQVDVLGLLESDLHRFVYGNRDLTRIMAEELGYYVDLGPGPNKHTWGAALLSKFPIINSTHHLLPSPHGELAPAIHATLDIHGEKVNIWVSHNGQEEDALDRELQTTEIAKHLAATEDVPTVFLGYLVTHPGDLRPWPYQILMEDGKMYDIEISDNLRWCEYIAFRGLWRIGFARLHESDISDTELQVGKFMLPKPGQKVHYETNQELYWHIGEDDIPEPWRMPRMFWDKGTRGHYYRVWIGPLYYMPPVRSGLRDYGRGWSTSLDGA